MKHNKLISLLLILEFAYILLKEGDLVWMYIRYFNDGYAYTFYIVFVLLMLPLGATGVYLMKRWAIIPLWVYVFLPLLGDTLSYYSVSFYSLHIFGFLSIVVNAIIVTYLTIEIRTRNSRIE